MKLIMLGIIVFLLVTLYIQSLMLDEAYQSINIIYNAFLLCADPSGAI